MAIDIWLEVKLTGFIPVSPQDWEEHSLLTVGSHIRATIRKGKSRNALRFYWALVDKVADGIGYTKDNLSSELLIRTGTIHALKFKDGTVHAIPKSIAKMDHAEFVPYLKSAVDMICAQYVSGIRRSQLLREVEKMVGISYAEATETKEQDGTAS